MRHPTRSLLLALAAGCAVAQPTAPNAPQTTFDVAALDRAADPCSNFYQFACGTWMAQHPVPGDKTRWGRFDELGEHNRQSLRALLEEAPPPGGPADPLRQKVVDYYATCMDEGAVNAAGKKQLEAGFKRIEAIQDRAGLVLEIARLHKLGERALFGFGATADLHDAAMQIAEVNDGGITLPDRDYYLKPDPKSQDIRAKYLVHIEKMLLLAGDPAGETPAEARRILALETELAEANMDRTLRRDPKNRDHKMSVTELQTLAPALDLNRYFAETGAPAFTALNVGNPEFFKTVSGALERLPLADWKLYLRWKHLRDLTPALSDPFVQESFEFFNKFLNGQKELEARWKRCVSATDQDLGEALGQLWVARHFPPAAKERMLELVVAVEEAMGQDLKDLPWMTGETKLKAAGKLQLITNKIGYPELWRDYSSVGVLKGDLAGNRLRAAAFEVNRRWSKIGTPVDKKEWGMTPPTVNAYYSSSQNNINFPAGILQGAFYGAQRDDAVNFGGIGAVIGHEISHGFDDQGSKFDGAGNLSNWWSAADRSEFDKRTTCITDQYEAYSPVEGAHLNGKLTLGENTADNGGTRLAFLAMQQQRQARPGRIPDRMEGFTPEQRFFLGWAQVWCQNVTPEAARTLTITDSHSAGQFRVNGVVSNSEAFAQAYQCKPGQPMVRANACRVW